MYIISALSRVAALVLTGVSGISAGRFYAARRVPTPRALWRIAILSCLLPAANCLAAPSVAPGSIAWASVAIGNKGGQKIATLTNGNTTAITISSITFSGANPGDFAIFSKTCGATLAPSASCTANILFGPTATGTRTATLNFNDSDGTSPQTVALTGLGSAPSGVAATPSSLSFAATVVGSGSVSQSVMLANGLSSSVTLGSIAVTGANAADFAISATTCGASLAASASCSAAIVFKPGAAGTRTATLSFTDSATNSPQTVALSGMGLAPSNTASVSPTSLSFASTSVGSASASQSVTLSNGPNSAITLGSVAISGANAADFTISGTTCGASLAASANCSAAIVFKPGAAGTRTATLGFTDSATNSPQTVALSGIGGGSSGSPTVAPGSIAWASVAIGNKGGQKIATLTNGNTTAITISGITFSGANPGDFAIFSKTCGSTLAPSASCTANIVFGPTATGTRTATLNFNDSDGTSPQTIALTGLGSTPASVAASPSSLAFAATVVGSGSVSQSVTLANGLGSSVTLGSIAITGANAADFAISATTCGASLAASASCSATMVFNPSAVGTRSATLSFTDSATNSPQAVALSGVGNAVFTISPQNPTVTVTGTVPFAPSVSATWIATCGSIGSNGLYIAPATQSSCAVVATAADGTGRTASTTVTVNTSITVIPSAVNLHALNTHSFTASQPVIWSASCGSISNSGVFTAPASPAACTITATASDGTGSTATASANVDVANYTARKGGGGLLGAQTNEQALTPSNVNSNSFGLSWTFPVDAWINAQPLYMNALTINAAPHNVVFVVTANDSVYAIDGDTGMQLWQVSLIPPGATAVSPTAVGFTSAPLIGILGTPVIDPATNTMYVVSETSEQNATYFPHRLHALDLATGSEKLGGPVLVNDPQMAPVHKLQRTGLALANGNIYFGIGSMQDIQPYHGLIFAFNAQTLAEQAVWVSTPTGSEGGVWMGSSAPSVDENGNIYVTTGNGTLDGSVNFGEAAVKLSPALQPLDYFAPYNYSTYNASDIDLGSGAIMVVPDQPGSHPHELIACGKPTPVYVLDRDNLGQLGATSDNIIQRLDNEVGAFAATTNSVQACFTAPAMWGQNVYFGGKYDVLKMFSLDPNTGLLSPSPVSQGSLAYGYPGADPVVSSSGATNGIVWTVDTKTDALLANDATNLANTLFSGSLPAPAIRWTVPTVINGHVYVGAEGKVFGFALK